MIATLLAWAVSLTSPPLDRGVPVQSVVLAVEPDRSAGFRPFLRVADLLGDPALEEAARSGLPLRLRLRVELWRDGFFDHLEGSRVLSMIVFHQPLEGRFAVRTESVGRTELRGFTSFSAARSAIETVYTLDLRPSRRGRYYYTAVLELETLSLSDLEELERWLKGELQPAVSGGVGSVPGAVGQGVKRLFIRVLGLPARRYEARSDWFRFG